MDASFIDPQPAVEKTFGEPADGHPFANPEMECEARFRERHPELDAQRLLLMVRSELGGVSVAKFLVEDERRTTAPENLNNPTGHYRRLARNVRNGEFVVREMEAQTRNWSADGVTRLLRPRTNVGGASPVTALAILSGTSTEQS
jgi:hypothetical protein